MRQIIFELSGSIWNSEFLKPYGEQKIINSKILRQSLLQKKHEIFSFQYSFSFGIYPQFRYANLSHFTKGVKTIW